MFSNLYYNNIINDNYNTLFYIETYFIPSALKHCLVKHNIV